MEPIQGHRAQGVFHRAALAVRGRRRRAAEAALLQVHHEARPAEEVSPARPLRLPLHPGVQGKDLPGALTQACIAGKFKL